DWWDVKGEIQALPAGYIAEDPFKCGPASALRSLPGGDDASMIRVDGAHTWAINGIGKDLYSSSLVLAARIGLFGTGSMEHRLGVAYDRFQVFVRKSSKYTSIDGFNYMTLKCNKTYTDFPSGLGKGHDCAIVGSWLEEELARTNVAEQHREIFEVMRYTVAMAGKFWRTIYESGEGYATLASLSARAGLMMFKIRPKLHMYCHLVFLGTMMETLFTKNYMDKVVVYPFCESIQLRLDLQNQMENDNAKYILSPTNFMVWSDEDFIGRIARLSRRVHKASTAKYTIDRAKCLYLRQWRRTFE
ncbi:unnamed protein product, partial [Symbiodinium pilosum]